MQMRKKLLVAVPLATLLLADMAMAANTANLTVTGRILPAVCDISLTAAAINYGVIGATALTAAGPTAITPNMNGTAPTTTMNILCDAPAQFAVKVTDNKLATVDTSVLGAELAGTATQIFGLGQDAAGTNIGAYTVSADAATSSVDAAVGKLIVSADGGANWTAGAASELFSNPAGWMLSWNNSAGPDAPEPITTVAQPLTLAAAVVARDSLDTTQPVNLDGSMTIEIVYL